MLQETKNPVTGEWEMLTPRQWWLIKLGMDKNSKVDDWTLAIIKGPKHAVGFAFQVFDTDRAGASAWLVARYKEWFPSKPRAKEFYEWSRFIMDVYDLDTVLPLMDELMILKKGIIVNSVDSMKMQIALQKKKSAIELRKYKKNWK
jgi:hypothetical protein